MNHPAQGSDEPADFRMPWQFRVRLCRTIAALFDLGLVLSKDLDHACNVAISNLVKDHSYAARRAAADIMCAVYRRKNVEHKAHTYLVLPALGQPCEHVS